MQRRAAPADYVAELAGVDPLQSALSVRLADDRPISVGDATMEFSIQRVSKIYTVAIASSGHGELPGPGWAASRRPVCSIR